MTLANGNLNPQLKSFVDRIEKLQDEQKSLGLDVKEVMAEAKAAGFDTKIIRKVLKIKSIPIAARNEEEELIRTYCRAIGVQMDLFDGQE